MNAICRTLGMAMLALTVDIGVAPASAAASDGVCELDCIEALHEGDHVHVFYVDLEGVRHHLSTSLKSEEQLALPGSKTVLGAPNVYRVHALRAADAAKAMGCGIDGWGWDAGETIWSREISNTQGPSGTVRTDARSVYLARGRAMLFTTTTTQPHTGVPTSSTSTAEIPASVNTNARECQQAR